MTCLQCGSSGPFGALRHPKAREAIPPKRKMKAWEDVIRCKRCGFLWNAKRPETVEWED